MKASTRIFLSLLCIGVFMSSQAFAQKKKKGKEEPPTYQTTEKVEEPQASATDTEYDRQKGIFKSALAYSDLDVATYALYNMLALKPEGKEYRDTLAFVYFQRGAYPQALLLGREILEANDQNNEMLELVAISEQSLGLVKESLASYEKLFARSNNVYHLYEIAALQYGLKRFGECEQTLNRVLGDEKAGEVTVSLNIDQQQRQEVPIAAAAYNMMGVMYTEMGKKNEALEAYKKAIGVSPDFVLAQKNIEVLEKGQ